MVVMVTKTEKATSNNVNLNNSLKPIQEALTGHFFSGWIGERKWIERLSNYRDIIEVDEWEDTINSQLNSLILGGDGIDSGENWINITGPSSTTPCYSLWVLLDELVPIGHYWFKIEDVLFDTKFGLNIIISSIRVINQFDGETLEERSRRQKKIADIDPAEVWKELFANVNAVRLHNIKNFMLSSVSPSNISACFRLVVIITMTCLTACKELCLFLLLFVRELGVFVQRSTPLFESALNFIGKIIGGVLIFLTMIYNDIRNPKPRLMPPPNNPPNQSGHSFGQGKAIRYIPPDNWQSQYK